MKLFPPEVYGKYFVEPSYIDISERMLVSLCQKKNLLYSRQTVRTMVMTLQVLYGVKERAGQTISREEIVFGIAIESLLVKFQDRYDNFKSNINI